MDRRIHNLWKIVSYVFKFKNQKVSGIADDSFCIARLFAFNDELENDIKNETATGSDNVSFQLEKILTIPTPIDAGMLIEEKYR
jgi:hypothetical protein